MHGTRNTPGRTLTDEQINSSAMFLPYTIDGDGETEALPCIVLAGDEDGNDGMQVYAYAKDGAVVVSLHYDTARPDEDGRGPWAYYGPDHAVPTRIKGGDGRPVYIAAEGVPDLSEKLVQDALAALGTHSLGVRQGRMGDRVSGGDACANLLAKFLAIVGRYTEDPEPELPLWHVIARVVARQAATSENDAIRQVSAALTRAGFDLIEDDGYRQAQPSLTAGTWRATVTVVALRRAPYGARALTELREALDRAGFKTAAPQPRDVFRSEGGAEVTELPAEAALRRAGERDPQEHL